MCIPDDVTCIPVPQLGGALITTNRVTHKQVEKARRAGAEGRVLKGWVLRRYASVTR